jgi:hypothetical protein
MEVNMHKDLFPSRNKGRGGFMRLPERLSGFFIGMLLLACLIWLDCSLGLSSRPVDEWEQGKG